MDRDDLLTRLVEEDPWDFLIVGGGATGLGTAVEAAARGYRTALIEAHDFAKGTSSRSTKLVHGGVRYLRQGNVSLVIEALRERGLLLRNAPHLVHNLSFVIPRYDWWEGPFYGAGLKVYDLLSGRLGLGPSRSLTRAETLDRLPTLQPEGLRGGVLYHDAQFDDARLAIALLRTFSDLGGVPVNYAPAMRLLKDEIGQVCGVELRDAESGRHYRILARVVVNATGVFADGLRQMDEPDAEPLLAPSQGVHLVLDRRFLPSDSAILVPQTDDGRVLFAVPWLGRVVVGTTDTPVAEASLEPRPLAQEIEFLLTHAARYLAEDPKPEDVLSCFAGLRPLVRGDARHTAALARDHTLLVSLSGLVTITGGKWTTYRRMGEDAVDQAALVAGLEERPSRTEALHLHGWTGEPEPSGRWAAYGSDAKELQRLARENPGWGKPLHPNLPYSLCEVVWAARHELARTVEDVLARRTRALLLDARASIEAAPAVAACLAAELGLDEAWARRQVEAYTELAQGYLLGGHEFF